MFPNVPNAPDSPTSPPTNPDEPGARSDNESQRFWDMLGKTSTTDDVGRRRRNQTATAVRVCRGGGGRDPQKVEGRKAGLAGAAAAAGSARTRGATAGAVSGRRRRAARTAGCAGARRDPIWRPPRR